MANFKFLNKIFPKSPDSFLNKSKYSEASLARLAHVNAVIDDISDIAHYELDVDVTNTITITTNKGIIDFLNWDSAVPDADWATTAVIVLVNDPILNVANRDNVYLQITPYYSPAVDDNFIPYVLATGFTNGLNISIWNANPAIAGANQGEGAFYLYYEIKSIA